MAEQKVGPIPYNAVYETENGETGVYPLYFTDDKQIASAGQMLSGTDNRIVTISSYYGPVVLHTHVRFIGLFPDANGRAYPTAVKAADEDEFECPDDWTPEECAEEREKNRRSRLGLDGSLTWEQARAINK